MASNWLRKGLFFLTHGLYLATKGAPTSFDWLSVTLIKVVRTENKVQKKEKKEQGSQTTERCVCSPRLKIKVDGHFCRKIQGSVSKN
jgi:hypothetical protein